MTSLNISLPENLKAYVECQVASGDWRTPSEYVRELIRQDKERRMNNLEQELLAAVKGSKIELSVADIRKKGLITALKQHMRDLNASELQAYCDRVGARASARGMTAAKLKRLLHDAT